MDILKERPELSNRDHIFAAFLRRHNAINNFVKINDRITTWIDDKGVIVANVLYDNSACTYRVFSNH